MSSTARRAVVAADQQTLLFSCALVVWISVAVWNFSPDGGSGPVVADHEPDARSRVVYRGGLQRRRAVQTAANKDLAVRGVGRRLNVARAFRLPAAATSPPTRIQLRRIDGGRAVDTAGH